MEGKKTKSNWFADKKQEKRKICQSFESRFEESPEFDAYIQSQYRKMVQEKNENPSLIIPHGFRQFVDSKSFKELLRRIYSYMDSFIEFQEKFEQINQKEEGKGENHPLFRLLRREGSMLEEKCKDISYAYMGILLGYGDNKMVFKDQYFFETMLYFLTQTLHENFEGQQFAMVDEELNRIFRTNAFNLIKRRHIEDEAFQKYPALKEGKYDSSLNAVRKLEKRLQIQKRSHYSMQLKVDRPKMIVKPVDISLSTFNSVRSRSPLIASFYPSEKEKLFSFGREVRQKESFIKTSRRGTGKTSFNLRKQANLV